MNTVCFTEAGLSEFSDLLHIFFVAWEGCNRFIDKISLNLVSQTLFMKMNAFSCPYYVITQKKSQPHMDDECVRQRKKAISQASMALTAG